MSESVFQFLRRNHYLLFALVKRDVTGKYKGSIFGLIWSIVEPVALLAIYTLVFGGLFQLRLPYDSSLSAYALYIFCGIVVWMAISDGINRCTSVIVDHVNMVKKVIFPVEILPLQVILSAIIHQLIGLAVLAAGLIFLGKGPFWTWLLLPFLLLPQFLITAGIGWLAASIAVFLRDIRQVVALGTICWMFVTPIFYPEDLVRSAFGGRFAFWLTVNPAAALLHNYRRIFLMGMAPDWMMCWYLTGLGILLFYTGWWWFKKTQKTFIDLI
ncbi:MAG: ABC transporter permease [Candidatus Erginobacter occultus]|nr:ABC transporter permease [Candidatus Erginobacter occultus]